MGWKKMYKILIELQFSDKPSEEDVNHRLKRILEKGGKLPYMELDMTTVDNIKRLQLGLGMHKLGV